MTKEDFVTGLRQFVRRQPFEPFAVEFRDGRKVIIKQLPVVYSEEGASFIDPDDGALVDFEPDEVKSFGLAARETMMTKDEFEASLRDNVHRQPFRLFVVHFRGGRRIVVKKPPLVFADGAASFIDLEEETLVEFHHEEVESISLFSSSSVCRVLDTTEKMQR